MSISVARRWQLAAPLLLAVVGASSVAAAPALRPENAHPVASRRHVAHVTHERFTTTTFTIPGAVFIQPIEINNRGLVSGFYVDESGRYLSFVWDRGDLQVIEYPGAQITSVAAITDNGLLFGNWGSNTEQTAGWYDLRTGTFTALPAFPDPAKTINVGGRITNAGTAVGQACGGTFFEPVDCVSWIWDGREYMNIPLPDSFYAFPGGVNNRGQVVGWSLDELPFGFNSFLYERGTVTPLTVVEGLNAQAIEITNSGRILFLAELQEGEIFKPVLYDRGVVTPLPLFPGAVQTLYFGMNEAGDMVGFALFEDGSSVALVTSRR